MPGLICLRKKLWTRIYSIGDQVPTGPVFTRAKNKVPFWDFSQFAVTICLLFRNISPVGRVSILLTVSPTEDYHPPTPQKRRRKKEKKSVSHIGQWTVSDGDLGSVEYPFIDITPKSTMIQSGSTIYGSNRTI